jgi:hypothetical protein
MAADFTAPWSWLSFIYVRADEYAEEYTAQITIKIPKGPQPDVTKAVLQAAIDATVAAFAEAYPGQLISGADMIMSTNLP